MAMFLLTCLNVLRFSSACRLENQRPRQQKSKSRDKVACVDKISFSTLHTSDPRDSEVKSKTNISSKTIIIQDESGSRNRVGVIYPSGKNNHPEVGWVVPGSDPEDIPESVAIVNFPTHEHPSHELLRDGGFIQLKYLKYHASCLKGNLYIFF
jgi:hypothetical protein